MVKRLARHRKQRRIMNTFYLWQLQQKQLAEARREVRRQMYKELRKCRQLLK